MSVYGWKIQNEAMPTHITSAQQLHSEIIGELNELLKAGEAYCETFIGAGAEAWKHFSTEVQSAVDLTNAAFASHTNANADVHTMLANQVDEQTSNANTTRTGTDTNTGAGWAF
nr:hypothetical protein [Actinomycetales bacterium]